MGMSEVMAPGPSAFWKVMAAFQAAVILPYSSFTLTFEELYNMAVPIMIPRHLSKHVYDLPFHHRYRSGFEAVFHRLANFEYFCRPMVTRFDSLADLFVRTGPGSVGTLISLRHT